MKINSATIKHFSSNINFYIYAILVPILFVKLIMSLSSVGMLKEIPHWVDGAIPAAIGKIAFNNKDGYTAITALEKHYFQDDPFPAHQTIVHIDERLQRIKNLDPKTVPPIELRTLGNDDKGIVAFNILAFRIFGQHGSSLYWLYFSLLGLSILSYLITFFKSPQTLLPLILLLLGFVTYTPMLFFDNQTSSLLALRSFPALSLCATLYFIMLYYLILFKQNINLNSASFKISTCFQWFLICLVIHVRTTALWQLMAITVPAGLALISVLARKRELSLNKVLDKKRASALNKLLIICVLGVCAFPIHKLSYSIYQKFAYSTSYNHEEYGTIKTRLFFHNIYSGLAFEPHLAELFQLRIDDWSIYDATGRYMVNTGQLDKWLTIIPSCVTNPKQFSCVTDPTKLSGQITNWAGYDRIVGEMLLNTCSKHLGYCISSIGYKLQWFGQYLLWSSNYSTIFPDYEMFNPLEWGDPMPWIIGSFKEAVQSNDLYVSTFNPYFIAILCATIAVYSIRGVYLSLISLGSLCIFSLATVVIGYPAPWANTETVITSLGALYLILILVIALIVIGIYKLSLAVFRIHFIRGWEYVRIRKSR